MSKILTNAMVEKVHILAVSLSPTFSIGASMIALIGLRKNDHFVAPFDFKRPMWILILVSVSMVVLGFIGMLLTPTIFRLLDVSCHVLGAQDIATIGFMVLMFGGGFCSLCCLSFWLWQLSVAIRSYFLVRKTDKTR